MKTRLKHKKFNYACLQVHLEQDNYSKFSTIQNKWGDGNTGLYKSQKNKDSSAECILMPQNHSAVCTALPSSPGLFNSYNQCRQNWTHVFLLGQVNNHVKPWCQHTPPYLLPHLTISLSLSPITHTEMGLLMLLPPTSGSLAPVLRPEEVSLDGLWQPKYQLSFYDASQHLGNWRTLNCASTVAANARQTLLALVLHRVETASLLSMQNSHQKLCRCSSEVLSLGEESLASVTFIDN